MRKLLLGLVLALSISTAFADGADVYYDYKAWLAATPGDHDAFGPPENLGELAVNTVTGAFAIPRGVFVQPPEYVWNDRVVLGGAVTTFSDGDRDPQLPYYAFGGFWDLSPGGWGQGLTLTLNNGDSFNICGDPVNGCGAGTLVPDGTFFGVVTSSFTTLSISGDGQPGNAETFDLSGLEMVHTPEPATMVLLGAGLLGLGLLRKSRR